MTKAQVFRAPRGRARAAADPATGEAVFAPGSERRVDPAEYERQYEEALRIFADNLPAMARAMVAAVVEDRNAYAFTRILDRLKGPVKQKVEVEQTQTRRAVLEIVRVGSGGALSEPKALLEPGAAPVIRLAEDDTPAVPVPKGARLLDLP